METSFAVLNNMQARIERMEKHHKIKMDLLRKAHRVMRHICVYHLIINRKGTYEQMRVVCTHLMGLFSKGPFDVVCEVVHELGERHLEGVAALSRDHIRYTADDLAELKRLIGQYRESFVPELTGKLTVKQTEKVNKALQELREVRERVG